MDTRQDWHNGAGRHTDDQLAVDLTLFPRGTRDAVPEVIVVRVRILAPGLSGATGPEIS